MRIGDEYLTVFKNYTELILVQKPEVIFIKA
jgi:hypothetical protein